MKNKKFKNLLLSTAILVSTLSVFSGCGTTSPEVLKRECPKLYTKDVATKDYKKLNIKYKIKED